MKKHKKTALHLGDPVYIDEKGQMYKESGRARIYLNGVTMKEIEARKKKKWKT